MQAAVLSRRLSDGAAEMDVGSAVDWRSIGASCDVVAVMIVDLGVLVQGAMKPKVAWVDPACFDVD